MGPGSLTASFAGTTGLLPASDAVGFNVTCLPGLDGVRCYLGAFRTALDAAARDDVRPSVKRKLVKTVRKLLKLVQKAQQPGRRGERALKKLARKFDALVKKVERLPSKKIAMSLRDTLATLAHGARAAVP